MRSRLLSFLTWCWILIAVATAAGVIWYVLWGGPATERTDRAQVAGTLWTVMVVMPPLLAWAWKQRKAPTRGSSSDEQVRDAAELLARRLEDTWSAQVIQRGIELPAPVAVRWSWAEGIGTGREDLQAS
ncbi:MAG: hypothetical protein QG608_1893, partial [Actinomycetota bacterium]|nr:hypothetical protein [Actinomycetota bacterium]